MNVATNATRCLQAQAQATTNSALFLILSNCVSFRNIGLHSLGKDTTLQFSFLGVVVCLIYFYTMLLLLLFLFFFLVICCGLMFLAELVRRFGACSGERSVKAVFLRILKRKIETSMEVFDWLLMVFDLSH